MKSKDINSLLNFKEIFFQQYQDLFIKEYGFFIPKTRISDLHAVLLKHLHNSIFDNFTDFFNHLSSGLAGKTLLNVMINDITIGETYFFRNTPHFDLLKEEVLPKLISRKLKAKDYTMHIWSAGCSTGEEVYSLAITVLEALPNPSMWDVLIIGTDINSQSINKALKGKYAGNRPKRHITTPAQKKYFDFHDTYCIANNEIKEVTKFIRHNLIKDPPPFKNPDIIFCRNVTIYFNLETTSKIIHKFYNILKNKGYLFVGHSETIWNICDKFETLDFPKGFIYQKNISMKKKHAEEPHAVIPDFKFTMPEKPSETSNDYEKIMGIDVKFHDGLVYFQNKENKKALQCFNDILNDDPNYTIAHFAKANIFSNEGKYQEGINCLAHVLITGSVFLEAYYLKAVLQMKLHKYIESISTFNKIIHIDSSFALAYFHLAHIFKELNDKSHELENWKQLKKICRNKSQTSLVYLAENFTYGTLSLIVDKALEGQ